MLLEYLVGPWGPGAKSRSWGPLLDAPAIDGISWENIMNKWFHIQDYLIMLKTYWCLLMNYLHSVLIWHLQMVANTFFNYINTCPPKLGISASLTGWNDPATTDDPSFYTHMFQVFQQLPQKWSQTWPQCNPMLPNLPLTETFSHPPNVICRMAGACRWARAFRRPSLSSTSGAVTTTSQTRSMLGDNSWGLI